MPVGVPPRDNLDRWDESKFSHLSPKGLSAFPDQATSNVSISLRYIAYAYINFVVVADDERLETSMDDIDDLPFFLVHFIQQLIAGRHIRAALSDGGEMLFAVEPGRFEGECRFRVNSNRGGRPHSLDVFTGRADLIGQFVALAESIAAHPCLGHGYVVFDEIGDGEFERICQDAEREWTAGLSHHEHLTREESQEAFLFEKIAAECPLSSEQEAVTDVYRLMLRTLEIPPEWRRHCPAVT
ncbi:MAG TPA: hypothetical protein HPQ04_08230 [Rhodospirillaceae bacterium]|nr:hypothetical protein [Rhodospirillaceae bacterium]